jgi:hypothetical protein
MRARTAAVALLTAILTLVPAIPRAQQSAQALPSGRTAGQRNVLVLSIDHFTHPYVRLLFEAFSNELLGATDAPAVYFESLDASLITQPHYLEGLRQWLRQKYARRRMDVVVPLGEDALAFLADAQGEPWPAAQVLYLEAGSVRVDTRTKLPRAGGLLLTDHSLDALATIKTILPGTTHVALLYGASAVEITRWGGFADKVRTAGLEPIELVGISLEETVAAVGSLPRRPSSCYWVRPWTPAETSYRQGRPAV